MFTTSNRSRFVMAILSLGLVAATTQFADAGYRRGEVNMRLARQNWRIDKELHNGTISVARADHLHTLDRQIRGQERLDASLDGGHITRTEQKGLNQLENGVSKRIGP
jgi:hypothetical protein